MRNKRGKETTMKANLMYSKIEMTKAEAVAAGKLNSEKFNELKALREMYPTFQIVIVKAAKKGEHFKGLTCKYREDYIKNHKAELLTEFFTLRGKDAEGNAIEMAAVASYGETKMWFLSQFTEFKAQAEKVEEIVEAARKSRAA